MRYQRENTMENWHLPTTLLWETKQETPWQPPSCYDCETAKMERHGCHQHAMTMRLWETKERKPWQIGNHQRLNYERPRRNTMATTYTLLRLWKSKEGLPWQPSISWLWDTMVHHRGGNTMAPTSCRHCRPSSNGEARSAASRKARKHVGKSWKGKDAMALSKLKGHEKQNVNVFQRRLILFQRYFTWFRLELSYSWTPL